ncbi:MAG: hypothetical protein DRP70_14110 [Spirochaetes bacterium]|nr:MAG: hypothetical protein DRP70_14110 [Spirochaetota bacterium]RKX94783.1 MAG: hypothetical protein DRZ90_11330 [Spirochaetota bacterium]
MAGGSPAVDTALKVEAVYVCLVHVWIMTSDALPFKLYNIKVVISNLIRKQLAAIILILLTSACVPKEENELIEQAACRFLLPEELLEGARSSILEGFNSSRPVENELIPSGNSNLGVFVRLKKENEERGCFTFYRGVDAPEPWLSAASRNAAFTDSRYPPLSPDETGITLEIAVIGELVRMSDPDDFIPGFHTVLIRLDGRQAILQAPLAVQRNLDGEAFLTMLSAKAGLSPRAWRNPAAELYRAPTIWTEAPLYYQ